MEEKEGELGTRCPTRKAGDTGGSRWDSGPAEGCWVVGNVAEEKVMEAPGASASPRKQQAAAVGLVRAGVQEDDSARWQQDGLDPGEGSLS